MVVLMDEGIDLIVQTISRDDEVCCLHPVFQVLLGYEPRIPAGGYMHGVNQRTTLPKVAARFCLERFRRNDLGICA
jgi:hypothetical protein